MGLYRTRLLLERLRIPEVADRYREAITDSTLSWMTQLEALAQQVTSIATFTEARTTMDAMKPSSLVVF